MNRATAVLVTVCTAATVLLTVSSQAAGGSITQQGKTAASSDIYLLDTSGTLSRRNADLPLFASHRVKVHGLNSRDRLVGIDVRPATGQLHALGRSGQLYLVQPSTGRATAVGKPPVGIGQDAVGFDFNPTVDRIRVVTSAGRNLRLHPDTSAVTATDGTLVYAAGSTTPKVAAAGYTNSVAGATTTGLYVLDASKDVLATQGSLPGQTPVVSPNTGRLFTVGRLGANISVVNGFDIAGNGPAIAAVGGEHGLLGASRLVRIDLRNGRATPLLALGLGTVVGLTFVPR